MNPNLDDIKKKAIHASLQHLWQEAIDLNLHIIQLDPQNLSALNRLAKAYEETGDIVKAKKTYLKVLSVDKFNSIASNNLNRIRVLPKNIVVKASNLPLSHFSFIEEPGKTKTVSLTKLAPHQVLSMLKVAQMVLLKPNKRRISIITSQGAYIGYLPDDLSLHLIQLIKLGNKYEAAIKFVSKIKVDIFIRETKKALKLKGLPSFPTKETSKYYQFLPTDPIAETPLEIDTSDDSEF